MTAEDLSGPDSQLIEMWRSNLRKSVQAPLASQPRPFGMDFGWSGGGQPLDVAATDPLLLEVPLNAKVVWAHLYALDGAGNPVPVTASVDLLMRQAIGGLATMHGDGSVPALSAATFADLDLTGWRTNLTVGDAIVARLATLTGVAYAITLTLLLRPTEAAMGILGVVDDAGDSFTDTSGNRFVFRS